MTDAVQNTAPQDVALLDRTILFSNLRPQHKEQIFSVLQKQSFPQNHVVFEEGAPGDALYIIRKGKVSVYAKNAELGVTFELATLGPGQVFGEMALLTQELRSASIRALEPTDCYVLKLDIFQKIINQLPMVSLGIAQTMACRLAEVNKQQQIKFGNLSDLHFDPGAYQLIPRTVLMRHKMIPLHLESHALTLAMVDPSNTMAIDDVRRLLRDVEIRPIAIAENDYESFLKKNAASLGQNASHVARSQHADASQLQFIQRRSDTEKDTAPGHEVVRIVSEILAEGLEREASDIHIDPDTIGVSVRYRIDGILQARKTTIPENFAQPIAKRIKVLANLDTTENHKPQDGRISLNYRDHAYDMRVATMPVRLGQRVVLRILDSSGSILEIPKLILAPRLAAVVEQLVNRPQGMVLIAGPTGSGKTTTLYSLLRHKMKLSQGINVVTAEDPIEYSLPNVAQVEINEARGLTFPAALRGFLRQDPDVILIGETRDAETAKIAIQAALTGHMVFSSMHANSAVETLVRLNEFEIGGFLIASALNGILFQRLARRVCPACASPKTLPSPIADSLKRVGLMAEGQRAEFKEGSGCEHCKGTGFSGRVGLYEVLPIVESVRALITRNAPIKEIQSEAQKHGMVTLAQYGAFLLKHGITTPDELLRLVQP